MDIARVDQISQSMQQRTTEELLAIWSENDREQWSDAAFEAISRTLIARGVDAPQQRIIGFTPPVRKKWGEGVVLLVFVGVLLSKALSFLTFGGIYPADQGRKTYDAMAATWGNEYAARLAGNRAAVLYAATYAFVLLVYFFAAKLVRRQKTKSRESVDPNGQAVTGRL